MDGPRALSSLQRKERMAGVALMGSESCHIQSFSFIPPFRGCPGVTFVTGERFPNAKHHKTVTEALRIVSLPP